jgi:hypothetical protein
MCDSDLEDAADGLSCLAKVSHVERCVAVVSPCLVGTPQDSQRVEVGSEEASDLVFGEVDPRSGGRAAIGWSGLVKRSVRDAAWPEKVRASALRLPAFDQLGSEPG